MPLAISLIVDGYVRLADRAALEALRAHRVGMLDAAGAIADLDVTQMTATLRAEIEIIDAGLARLNAPREAETRTSDSSSEPLPPRGGGSSV